jgi:alanyl-tRNA synthetase
VRRARSDFEVLSAIARIFSAPLDETADLVGSLREKLVESDRARLRLAIDLAQIRGRAAYSNTLGDSDGMRIVQRCVASLDDELRAEAQAFTAGDKSLFLAICEQPPSVLIAASKDSGVNAGSLLKAVLTEFGGRGGGNAVLAQGSFPNADELQRIIPALLNARK